MTIKRGYRHRKVIEDSSLLFCSHLQLVEKETWHFNLFVCLFVLFFSIVCTLIPRVRTEAAKKSFFYSGAQIFNYFKNM